MERSKVIFGNPVSDKIYQKACKSKAKYQKKFGDDSQVIYPLTTAPNPILEPHIGVHDIQIGKSAGAGTPETPLFSADEKPLIIGNIRMGFGHYRISMAIASAANAMGYKPYWLDLHAFQETTGGKVIGHLNSLYSMGSRWSQKYPLFNKFYWEPLNSEGFRKLSYNAMDQKVAELMTPVMGEIPKHIPVIATHVWPAQAALHAGFEQVVNVIPDNWPMALHLAEGSIHTVQTPSSFLGYKTLKGMDGKKILKSIPEGELVDVGHYIDHELVVNLEADNQKRLSRIERKHPKRVLLTVGGAGAQQEIFINVIRHLLPLIEKKQVALLVNVGDHRSVWEGIVKAIPELASKSAMYFDQWDKTQVFADQAIDGVSMDGTSPEPLTGIHAFYHKDIFAAVYASNLLMRATDILITKPSELSFYPVPKLLIKRVGGHEAWGAVRAAEVGDGTIECETNHLALQMLDLLLNTSDMLKNMVVNIDKANQIGVYDGAYKAVALATKNTISN